ncbi:MAG: DUF3365 domain-containing protein [Anaeromyxobacter sp.]|nr:DUF3365 domain-containing protein [Anaeromyxobacter sp.]MBL0275696.1 DUF3365 domain-containing protein [Anaeromyxobacter sp.]
MPPAHPTTLALASAALLALGCAASPAAGEAAAGAAATFDPAQAPPALAPAVARAEAAVKALQQRLARRLMEEMASAPGAVKVCRQEAPAIAAEVAAAEGLAVGRTSLRLRNPANAPRAWARPTLAGAAGKKAAELKAVAVDLGDRVGYLRPIGVATPCLKCHGPAEGITPGVVAALAEGYPTDQATGFAEGDLRGWFWAEVKKDAPRAQ